MLDCLPKFKKAAPKTYVTTKIANATLMVSRFYLKNIQMSSTSLIFTAKDELLKYKENSQCLQYAVSLRQGTKDVSNILCSVSVSINKNNIDKMTDAELLDVFEDVY